MLVMVPASSKRLGAQRIFHGDPKVGSQESEIKDGRSNPKTDARRGSDIVRDVKNIFCSCYLTYFMFFIPTPL